MDIIETAKKAEAITTEIMGHFVATFRRKEMEAFAALIRQDERERCAKLCDDEWNGDADTYQESMAYNECAKVIRELT